MGEHPNGVIAGGQEERALDGIVVVAIAADGIIAGGKEIAQLLS